MKDAMFAFVTLLIPTSTSAAASSNCPCLTSFPSGLDPSNGITIGGESYTYPASYGLGSCGRHDSNLPPTCNAEANVPEWCSDEWCYVDHTQCNLPTTTSSYFPGSTLHYSYSTCGDQNTFTLWFGNDEVGSGEEHVAGDIVTVIHDYLISLSSTLEDNEPELRDQSEPCSAPAPPSCPCSTCRDDTEESVFWTNSSYTLATWNATRTDKPYSFDFASVSLTAKPSISTTSPDGILERCLSGYLENSFLRVAAREADIDGRVGYEYAAFQGVGNYVQWPATQWCTESYDPRFRSWYVSAASGPKDIVIVLDTSGSMRNNNRMGLMKEAAKKLLDTFTDVDFIGLVRFSSSAEVADDAATLLPATSLATARMKQWVDGLQDGGTTNFNAAFNKAFSLFEQSTDFTSGCTRAILFLSDGKPDEAPSYGTLRTRASDLGVQVFTYALGSGAQTDVLKRAACQNGGALWQVADGGGLADAMADYYTFLAPLQSPCQVRWTYYNDINTGAPLLAACLASFKKAGASDSTSCAGGTDGCVPDLLGVACMDASLIATREQIDARPDAQSFYDRVSADQTACSRVTPTAAQLQVLRSRIRPAYGDAICSAEEFADSSDYAAPASCSAGSDSGGGSSNDDGSDGSSNDGDDEKDGADDDSDGPSMGMIIGVVAGGGAVVAVAVGCYVRQASNGARGLARRPPVSAAQRAFPHANQESAASATPTVQAQYAIPMQAQAVPVGYPAQPQQMPVAVGVAVA